MASSTDNPKAAPDETKTTESAPSKLVVFGGNGFVGSRVCEAGVDKGFQVVSVNRSGNSSEKLQQQLEVNFEMRITAWV